jgi:hypothetical protein
MEDNFDYKKYIAENPLIIIKENIVDDLFYDVLELIRKRTRQMNDDEAFEFHEKLKKWTNKLI